MKMENFSLYQRDITIDTTKAIGIVLMVLGHCAIPSLIRNFIFSFHMPLFFILSGYFYKEQSTRVLLEKGYKRLVKPYFVTSIVCIILCFLSQDYHNTLQKVFAMFLGSGSGHILGYPVPVIGPIWFLLALFWCKIFYNIIYTRTRYVFLICFCISTIAFVFGKYVTCLPLGILYGLCSLVFYSMGHYWKKNNNDSINNKFLLLGVFVWCFCIWKGHLEIATYDCSLYPISMLGAFVGTYVIYKIAAIIPAIFHSLLQWLGNNTLLILCYHTIYFYLYSLCKVYVFEPQNIEIGWQKIIICFALSFGLPYIHIHLKKIFCGKKF